MFGLPQSTEYGKRIPKQKFYDNRNVSSALSNVSLSQVKMANIIKRRGIIDRVGSSQKGYWNVLFDKKIFE